MRSALGISTDEERANKLLLHDYAVKVSVGVRAFTVATARREPKRRHVLTGMVNHVGGNERWRQRARGAQDTHTHNSLDSSTRILALLRYGPKRTLCCCAVLCCARAMCAQTRVRSTCD